MLGTCTAAANPGRWLMLEGPLELDGDVVTVGGKPLAQVLRELYLPELELAAQPQLALGRVRLEVNAA